jgi:endonuclease/exonuclease/phosphatase family metal-dependent hydrolase
MLPDTYRLVSGRSDSEVGILYAADRWQELDAGVLDLGNDDGWGNRIVRWAKMGYIGTDSGVYVYATHFCVPIRPSEDRCDVDRQVAHARRIVEHIESHDSAAILGGDFNVFDGFEEGPVVSFFKGHGLVDVLREVTAQPVITFEGNDWAPAGRIDYLFATRGVHVSAASVGEGSGSDHRFVAGTMLFE